ncbi:MAG TPA: IS21 family transposase [Candidatus Acidoferrales bacterium]|nr:IS21 family transposase [Candidatus Acidoferrales bacterium]
MERKIVEMLLQGVAVKAIARSLHVGKKRVKQLRALAEKYGYLAPDGGPGAMALPVYPEAVFPDRADGRSQKLSDEHIKLDAVRDWIKDRLEVGWQPITVFEELPAAVAGVSRSSFYRYLARAELGRVGKHYRVVPEIVHEPGEALIIDWGKLCDVVDPTTGKKRAVWAFVGVLGYSRLRLVRLVWTMDVETTLRVLEEMLREIDGVVRKVTMDNAKCIALEASRYEPVLNPVAERFANHYGFYFECLPPAEPQMKGHVERQIPFVRRLRQSRDGKWEGIESEEEHLRRKLLVANEQLHGTTRRRPKEVFADEERPTLKKLPVTGYEIERYHEGIVRKDGYVRFDSKYYAAGDAFVGKTAVVIANSKQVALYHDGKLIELHERLTDRLRMKAAKPHQLKPWEKTIKDGAFYCQRAAQIGPNVKAWVEEVLRQGQGFVDTRRVWGVLSLDKRYGREQIDAACGRALELGSTSYRMVIKMLDVAEALGTGEGAPLSSTSAVRPAANYKYARSLEEYQKLLPLWRQDTKEGHA